MIGAIIGIMYLTIGVITSANLLKRLEKALGEGTAAGTFLIAYINMLFWPVFFPLMIKQIKIEAKKKDEEDESL